MCFFLKFAQSPFRQTEGKTDRQKDRKKNRQTDSGTNRQKDRNTNKRSNSQNDRHINRELREITDGEYFPYVQ